jgi:hypothetical protein
MPTVYVPDELVFEIVKLGKNHKQYIKEAIREKLEREGVLLKRESR